MDRESRHQGKEKRRGRIGDWIIRKVLKGIKDARGRKRDDPPRRVRPGECLLCHRDMHTGTAASNRLNETATPTREMIQYTTAPRNVH